MSDNVNHPKHYTQHPSGVECITITEHFNFNVGNAIKYLWRSGLKGHALEDLLKAQWYVAREIDRLEKDLESAQKRGVAEQPQQGKLLGDAGAAPEASLFTETTLAGTAKNVKTGSATCRAPEDRQCNCIVNEERNARYRENVKQLQQEAALRRCGPPVEDEAAVFQSSESRD